MNDNYFFADADTPFHVWVRERGAHGYRWVLRHASQVIAHMRAEDGKANVATQPR